MAKEAYSYGERGLFIKLEELECKCWCKGATMCVS